jgi:soluble cytochrome b562
MKIRVLLFSTLCALLAFSSIRAANADDDEDTELSEHMEKLEGAYKRLNREVADPTKKEDMLKQVATMRTHAQAALSLQPAKTTDLPEDQRVKFVDAFHDKIKALIADIGKLDTAVKADNFDQAKQLLATLKQDQREGHHEFQRKKKHT